MGKWNVRVKFRDGSWSQLERYEMWHHHILWCPHHTLCILLHLHHEEPLPASWEASWQYNGVTLLQLSFWGDRYLEKAHLRAQCTSVSVDWAFKVMLSSQTVLTITEQTCCHSYHDFSGAFRDFMCRHPNSAGWKETRVCFTKSFPLQ